MGIGRAEERLDDTGEGASTNTTMYTCAEDTQHDTDAWTALAETLVPDSCLLYRSLWRHSFRGLVDLMLSDHRARVDGMRVVNAIVWRSCGYVLSCGASQLWTYCAGDALGVPGHSTVRLYCDW